MIRITRVGQDSDRGTQVLEFPVATVSLDGGIVSLRTAEGDFHYPRLPPTNRSKYTYHIEIPKDMIISLLGQVLDRARGGDFLLQ